jgi:large subunit ribosomal protein L6
MSKIGRKPIAIKNVQVTVNGQEVSFKGPKNTGLYALPTELEASVADGFLTLHVKNSGAKQSRDVNRVWGLHRALLSNAINGASEGFEKTVKINGLGFKAAASGDKLVFSLGYSHKIDFLVPKQVSVVVDKTGQILTVKSSNKELAGAVVSKIEALRPTEPYKGTGIKEVNKPIFRKPGKTKSS